MTLDGTNTWVLIEPGSHEALVVDPGPLHEGHLAAVLEHVDAAGARVTSIALTHGHPDHAEAARRFAELTRAPVRALDPAYCLGSAALGGGDVLMIGGLEVRVVSTRGHTGDSLSFLIPADRALLTGDTVLGRGTTVVAHPDGRLADYFDSLRLIRRMTETQAVGVILPGHGPVVTEPKAAVEFYLTHRAARLAQVEAALEAGDRTADQIVRRVYADIDPRLWPAAELSVLAQLEYLNRRRNT
ncbi:MBL fold metallo-hydrolase [Actinocrinis puniceicyclus]|uniref:MBL fold metallo-hydrolase n=1 Tax=Actinocrinis puniceicyclus TaxID=977794 RepID=A0A8J7WI96_9ACTN|nr:MBL fold metallo-hydrolase [Actinocrinis puniceicyclus]